MLRTPTSLFRRDPPRPPDRHASGRTRPLDPQCGSVTVPTPLPTAHGVHPTISVASRSPVEGSPDQRPHFPAQPRARWSRGRAPIQSTFDPVCGRLWAVATFTRPASRAVRALWPGPRSPGLAGPPPWPNGRVWDAPSDFCCELCAPWRVDDLSTLPRPSGTVTPAEALIQTASGVDSAILAHLDRSLTTDPPPVQEPQGHGF